MFFENSKNIYFSFPNLHWYHSFLKSVFEIGQPDTYAYVFNFVEENNVLYNDTEKDQDSLAETT